MKNKELTIEEKAKLARAAYMKEWRKKHPNKQKEYQEKSWARAYDKMQIG